ncbi:unnamed protein product, partial [Dicrocoelium dendriticum]
MTRCKQLSDRVDPQMSLCVTGVYVGSSARLCFGIENQGPTEALVEFHLDKRREFFVTDLSQVNSNATLNSYSLTSIHKPDQWPTETDPSEVRGAPIEQVIVSPKTNWGGVLHFRPSEVAVYDFAMEMTVNKLPLQSATDMESESTDGDMTKSMSSANDVLPKILAVGLRQPIELSPESGRIDFVVNTISATTRFYEKLSQ